MRSLSAVRLCAVALASGLSLVATDKASAAIVYSQVTGSYYEEVLTSITWSQALTAAASRTHDGRPGRLATVTSAAENAFILANLTPNFAVGYWIGGFQPAGSEEPAGGWRWITGEPFNFTFWEPGEPNNSIAGGENAIEFYPNGVGDWNDLPENAAGLTGGYIVEYAPVPEPASLLLLACGAAGLLSRRASRARQRA